MKAQLTIIIILLSTITFGIACIYDKMPKPYYDTITVYAPKIMIDTTYVYSDWDLFTEALIFVESGGDEKALSKDNDGGVLQLRPIAVREGNRIIGLDVFADSDRFDRQKSIEIYETIQEYHNPERSFEKALKIHNPNGGKTYRNKVMNKYKQLKDGND